LRNKQPFFEKNLYFNDFFVFGRKPHNTAGAAEGNQETSNRFSKSFLIFKKKQPFLEKFLIFQETGKRFQNPRMF
jgi:hypothetical protein